MGSRRVFLVVIAAALAVAGSAACTTGEDDEGADLQQPGAQREERAPLVDEPAAETRVCTNEEEDFRVEFPAEWYTNVTGDRCEWFHPSRFATPDEVATTQIAVHLDITDGPLAAAVEALAAPAAEVVRREELTTAGGQEAVLLETVASENSLPPEGTRQFRIVVAAPDGRVFVVGTTAIAEGEYAENKAIAALITDTLRFEAAEPAAPGE